MRVRLTPETTADVEQIFTWYSERSAALGRDFLGCLSAVMHQLAGFPEIAPAVHSSVRRVLLHRFPYCVFYAIENRDVVVLGCFHAHRNPEVWRLRSKNFR